MLGWSKTDLSYLRTFLCKPAQLQAWSTYMRHKDPQLSKKRGLEKKTLVKPALQLIRNNEKILIGLGMMRLENETWVAVKLVRDNRKKGGVWEGRQNGELEEMCRIGVEILKMLDAEFAKGRVDSSAIAKLM
jgi:hypothetical protein